MLAAAGGGDYGGTDWSTKDVKFMWAMIADQDTEIHFGVVGGWQKMSDLVNEHISRMTRYREELTAAWPPEKSPASAAYITQLDSLINHLRGTLDAASANYQAFSTVTLTLARARTKMHRIHTQYEANEQLNLAWQATRAAAPKPIPAPSATETTPPPPISGAQQEHLNNEARKIMYDLSSAILSGRSALQKPNPYKPGGDSNGTAGHNRDGSWNKIEHPLTPIIPPPEYVGGAPGSTSIPESPPSTTPTHPAPSEPISDPIGSIGGGPILGGTITNPAANSPGVESPTTLLPSPATPGPISGIIAPRTPEISHQNGSGSPDRSTNRPAVGTTAGRPTTPSGGTTGAVPGSGIIGPVPGGSPARSNAPPRVNPVGGVIGPPGVNHSRIAGRTNSADPSSTGVHHIRFPHGWESRQLEERKDTSYRDPDNPWTIDKGVDPVVLPPPEPGPIDPGPAIGYSR